MDIKDLHPVELSEYALIKGIDDESAFSWWVPYTLTKKDQIIPVVNCGVKKKTHKYGIEVQRTVGDTYLLDQKSKNSFWCCAINKEIKNAIFAFNIMDPGENVLVSYSKLGVHMVFDMNLDIIRKDWLVVDGHLTPNPVDSTFACVVCRETVQIALSYVALLNEPCME